MLFRRLSFPCFFVHPRFLFVSISLCIVLANPLFLALAFPPRFSSLSRSRFLFSLSLSLLLIIIRIQSAARCGSTVLNMQWQSSRPVYWDHKLLLNKIDLAFIWMYQCILKWASNTMFVSHTYIHITHTLSLSLTYKKPEKFGEGVTELFLICVCLFSTMY